MTTAEQQLAAQVQAAWTNFAKSGSPSGLSVTQWPRCKTESSLIHELVPPTPYSNSSFSTDHKCNAWEPLLVQEALQSGSLWESETPSRADPDGGASWRPSPVSSRLARVNGNRESCS